MRLYRSNSLLCAVLVLGGCAGIATPEPNTPPTVVSHANPSTTTAADKEAGLYLAIVEQLIKQGRQAAAIAFLDSYARDSEPLSPHYWDLRGNALLGLDRDAEARIAFANLHGTALAAHGWNGMGRAAAAQHDWQAAALNFRKAIEDEPANADFLNNLAFADMHLGKADNSAACLRQAHELSPDSELIRNNLIIALTLRGDRNGADAVLAGIKDTGHREAVKSLVRNAIETGAFNVDSKS